MTTIMFLVVLNCEEFVELIPKLQSSLPSIQLNIFHLIINRSDGESQLNSLPSDVCIMLNVASLVFCTGYLCAFH